MENRLRAYTTAEPTRTEPVAPPTEAPRRRQLQQSLRTLENYIANYPKASMATALLVGVFFGWLIKRR